MSVRSAGIGCVTPLGGDLDTIWRRIEAGERAAVVEVTNPETGRKLCAAPVPAEYTAHLGREPRLRRSSAISLLAAAAGKAALADSSSEFTPAQKSRLAIVFGSVQYTRRFYEQIVKQGANTASPMLFPETVYNAPASHLAAMLGVDGATYTLVGDGTVGLQALHFGTQLLELGDADHVLVVAAEELDWALIEAHRDWRLARPGKGALLAEGAAAVLLGHDGRRAKIASHPGESFISRREAPAALDRVFTALKPDGVVDIFASGANGTWVDALLRSAAARHLTSPAPRELVVKEFFGEAIGAGALLQVVLATDALERQSASRALVAALGWNQQASGALITR